MQRQNIDYGEIEFLKNYKADEYERPSATVDMLIFTVGERETSYRELPTKKLKLLLIRRRDYPFKGKWAIPGGFININENLYDSAKRELEEETNLKNIYMEQLYTWGDLGRDPRTRVISTSYMALVPEDKMNFKAGDDAAEAGLFSVTLGELDKKVYEENGIITSIETTYRLSLIEDKQGYGTDSVIKETKKILGTSAVTDYEILSNGMAFDHCKIIMYALERLRNKVEYTTIAFNLLGDTFTIGELKSLYETILGKRLTSPNFRRKVMPMLEEVEQVPEKNRGHRPAKRYRLSQKAIYHPFKSED